MGAATERTSAPKGHEEHEVSAAEDLMREHGILQRALLVYEAALDRIAKGDKAVLRTVGDTADLLRSFVEDYHETLEEELVFPRLEQAGKLVDVVAVLRIQHDRGRVLTNEIRMLTRTGGIEATADGRLGAAVRAYIRMYRPHAAQEDTVLFPAFREVVGGAVYRELGEQFEEREHALFGEGGFRTIVAEVGDLERTLGIYDLAAFTPA